MNHLDQLAVLRAEVLRWNRSFSLVSRLNPEERTDALMDECVAAGEWLVALLGNSPAYSSVQYVDLGTGGGFPGLVWHGIFSDSSNVGFSLLGSLLVEPRDKRAWFLEQAVQKMVFSGVSVAQMRWGAAVVDCECQSDLMVISMKALAMSDDDVLSGLSRSFPGYIGPCLIVRFVSVDDVVNIADESRAGASGSFVDSLSWGENSEYCVLLVSGKARKSGLLLSWCP